jgi:ABC-2 type transport system permease protein
MKVFSIANKDLKTYFMSPIGYMVISSFLFLIGFMFYQRLLFFVRQSFQSFNMGQDLLLSLNDAVIKPLYGTINILFLFIVPLITMRLISEEKKQKTIELLLTSPLRTADIVLGKFLSAMYLLLIVLLATLVYPLFLYINGNPDPGQIVSMYIGLVFLSGAYISIGLFWSSLTENQIIAASLTFFSLLFLWIIDWGVQNAGETFSFVLSYLSVIRHFENFGEGVLSLIDITYYVSFIFVFLYFTHISLDSRARR